MKKRRLRVTFEVDYEYPDDWDDEMLSFHLNESAFCTNTLLETKLHEPDDCACSSPRNIELLPEGEA